MSKIEKLSILGVRSFDNQRSETIQFYSPLTLVVGFNGSGKTTIIECLKYATTGILPANSKLGGAFIHDPKLCGEKEVMAQVKLQFKSSTGAKMVATRSLQLTVNKTKRTQKTLDGNLLVVKDGERSSISTRVAELDSILPQKLGVSTAVLDNVIFCHQDDSLWPLAGSSELKKKFDEIFEAQKYTQAIDAIKKIRKAHNEELGKYKIMEQHAKEDKDRSERANKRSRQLHDEIEALRVRITDLEDRVATSAGLASKAWKEAESYAEILGALEGKKITAQSKETTINDIKIHLKEVPESDEWLQSTLDEFESRLDQYRERKQAKQDEYVKHKSQYDSHRELLGQKQTERGQHQSDKSAYDRQVSLRKDRVREAATKHSMRGYDDLSDDTLVDDFMFKIQKVLKNQAAALDCARREADSEKKEAQTVSNRLTERRAALQESKLSAKHQMSSNDREASDYQKKVDQISTDEGSKAIVESRIDNLNSRIQTAKEAASKSEWDKIIKAANIELRAYEEDSSRLNNDLIQGTKKAGEMAKLSHLKQELKDRQRSLQTMLSTHSSRINKLVGPGWEPATVEQHHQIVLDEAAREVSSAEQTRDATAREMEQVQFKQKTLKREIEQKQTDRSKYYQEVKTAIDGEPLEYHKIQNQMQENLEGMRIQSSGSKSLVTYLNQILDTANGGPNGEKQPQCRVCRRDFRDDNDPTLAALKKRLAGLVARETQMIGEEDLKDSEAEYQTVVDAAIPLENWKRLAETEIPAMEQDLRKLSDQGEALVTRTEEHDKIVEKHQLAKRELDQLSRTVASIAKCHAETVSLESQIKDASSKSQHDGARTLDDIQKDIANLAEKIRATKKTISQLTNEKDQSRTDISGMELELRDLKNELNTITFQLEKKTTLMARVEEFRALNQKHRDAMDKADSDIDKFEPEIATAKAKYDDIAQRAEVQERELSRKSSELAESVNALDLLNKQIKSYIDRGGSNQLSATNREIKRIEQDMTTIEAEQNERTREINKIQEQLRDSESTKRQYSDNLRYRQESRALDKLRAEIQALRARNAEVDRDRFQQEANKRQREHQRLSAEQAGLIGEMKSKDSQLLEFFKDFETDYRDAPKRYKEAHIKVETTKAAVEDLGRYGGALDKAIMKYHSLKMEEINRIIEELWQRTYQGTDVDTILIKFGNESATGARSYNYRVCMIKQGTEMDMRGRCSAGQKVLASIIIRLALAECFGTNCGLIALDEPTTNLDTDNVRSLAESLHTLIKQRKGQSNFQLIVITHDEDFLRAMKCGDFADNYYRVSRDKNCNSIIERQSIAEVM